MSIPDAPDALAAYMTLTSVASLDWLEPYVASRESQGGLVPPYHYSQDLRERSGSARSVRWTRSSPPRCPLPAPLLFGDVPRRRRWPTGWLRRTPTAGPWSPTWRASRRSQVPAPVDGLPVGAMLMGAPGRACWRSLPCGASTTSCDAPWTVPRWTPAEGSRREPDHLHPLLALLLLLEELALAGCVAAVALREIGEPPGRDPCGETRRTILLAWSDHHSQSPHKFGGITVEPRQVLRSDRILGRVAAGPGKNHIDPLLSPERRLDGPLRQSSALERSAIPQPWPRSHTSRYVARIRTD